MKAGMVATRYVVPRCKICRVIPLAECMLLLFAINLGLAGCSNDSDKNPPQFIGTNYAAVPTNNPVGGTPQAETLALFYYPDGPKGTNRLLWPYLTLQEPAVFDRLIVFNGGRSEEVLWKYYPALLAYAGNGNVVEISLLASRHIPRGQIDWTNYAFSLVGVSNHFVRLDATQSLPMYSTRPQRVEVMLDQADILKAIHEAPTNGELREFKGVKYWVAP